MRLLTVVDSLLLSFFCLYFHCASPLYCKTAVNCSKQLNWSTKIGKIACKLAAEMEYIWKHDKKWCQLNWTLFYLIKSLTHTDEGCSSHNGWCVHTVSSLMSGFRLAESRSASSESYCIFNTVVKWAHSMDVGRHGLLKLKVTPSGCTQNVF